jgi:putative FmdB family regulatory protein
MPIYEYRCGACGHHLEALQGMTESPLRKCPECGKSQLKRLVSASAFRLKGNGWYETDFKNDKEKKRNLVDSGEPAEASADKAADGADKEETGKAAETAKSNGHATRSVRARPVSAKPAKPARPTRRKRAAARPAVRAPSAAKARARAARV